MSLDAWEEHALKSIADALAASTPELASRLLMFNRLTSGERMPGDQRVVGEGRREHHSARPRRRSWCGQAGQVGQAGEAGQADWSRGPVMHAHGRTLPVIPVVAILTMVTVIMIAVALVLSFPGHPPAGTGDSHCAQTWPIPCSGR